MGEDSCSSTGETPLVNLDIEDQYYREKLFNIGTDTQLTADEKLIKLIDIGREALGFENAHLVKIEPDSGLHKAVFHSGSDLVEADTESELSETFCRHTIDSDDIFSVNDAATEHPDDPAYELWGISSYLGGQITVEGDQFGTLCMVDEKPRDRDISEPEKQYMRQLIQWVTFILQRERHERDLQNEEHRFQELIRRVDEFAIFLVETDGTITSWNEGANRIYGYESEAIIGEHIEVFYPGTSQDRCEATEFLNIAATEDRVQSEGWRLRDDGTRFWALESIIPLFNTEGTVTEFGIVARDLTAQRPSSQLTEDQLTLTQEVIDVLEDLLLIIGSDGNIQWVNKRAKDFAGIRNDELGEIDPLTFVAEEDRERVEENLTRSFEFGESLRTEVTVIDKLGQRRSYEFATSPMRDAHGSIYAVAGIGRDITERELYQQRLDVAQRILRHNLRNDITTIRGWAEKIQTEAPPEQSQAAGKIIDTADGLIDLAENTRMMADLDSIGETSGRPVEVSTAIREIVEEFRTGFPEATIDARIDPNATGQAQSEKCIFVALRQTLENAIEHNQAQNPWVSVSLTSRESIAEIVIEDDGPGIPVEERRVLMEGDETPLEHGSGIGLWAVHWCITTMGGTVSFDEREPQGTAVILEIPVQ